ncbi:hypothetical protein MMC10_005644 [Thelotrema lepadinum]|nr:hypothetical protein [Thelotrema lepadinum]
MAETVVLPQNGRLPTDHNSPLSSEIAQYDRILSLRDDVLSGKHTVVKPSIPMQVEANAVWSNKPPKLPNGNRTPLAMNHEVVANNSNLNANYSQSSNTKLRSPSPQFTGLDPIFLQESEVVVKAKMKLERQRIEKSIQEQYKQKRAIDRLRVADQKEILPDYDISETFFQALELVKPIQSNEANTANRHVSSSDTVDDNTYYSSQANESAAEESDDHSKRRATKPCRFYFEGSCKKGDNCTFSHDAAFKQKLLSTTNAQTNDRDSAPNSRTAARGYTAKGGRIRDSPTYDSRESGELIEDTPYSPTMQIPVEDLSKRAPPPNDQSTRNRNGGNMRRTRSQAEGRQTRRATPPSKEGRIVRNHITSPAAPQPSRVSPLAVAKVSRVDRNGPVTGEPSQRQVRQPASGQQTPVIAAPPKSKKRRRDLDTNEASRNVAPRRQIESPGPYIKEEPMSPPPLQALPPSRLTQREDIRRPVEMIPPSPRYGERIVYQPIHEEYSHLEAPNLRRVASPSVRRVVSGPAHQPDVYREPDLRRVVSTRYIERPASPPQDFVSVSAHPRSTRAGSHYAAQPEETPQLVYRASVQPQRPNYAPDDRPASPLVRYSRQPPTDPEILPMAPPPRRIVVDEHGNRYYEAPVQDRRASAMPDVRYAPEISRHVEQAPPVRASVRPENIRVYHDDNYARRVASPQPPSPQYVQYRASVQPPPRHTVYEPPGAGDDYRHRNEVVRVVERPQGRRMEEYHKPRESVTRMQSVRPGDMQYEVPTERYQRVQTVQPEQHRYIDAPQRDGPAYLTTREVREVGVRPEERYAPQEYVDPGRPRYRYVSTSHGIGPGPATRAVEGDIMM